METADIVSQVLQAWPQLPFRLEVAEPGPLRCFLDMDDAFAHVRTTLKDEE